MAELRKTRSREKRYAEIALPLPVRKLFTYRLSDAGGEEPRPGVRVVVPFGKRELTGYLINILDGLPENSRLNEAEIKPITKIIDTEPLITDEIMRLAEWTADYYAASLGEVLKASLPAGINAVIEKVYEITAKGREALDDNARKAAAKWEILRHLAESGPAAERSLVKLFGKAATVRSLRELRNAELISQDHQKIEPRVKAKRQKAVRLLPAAVEEQEKPLTHDQQRIIGILAKAGGEMLFTDVLERADTGASPVNTLAKRGLLEVYIREIRRDPFGGDTVGDRPKLKLNDDQETALAAITASLKDGDYKAFLLHGVTGSGKTEVYIRAMAEALEMDRSSLMLVPEIALTPVFSRRLREAFGSSVAILHSNLSAGERFDEWRRIRNGTARIAIGTRSAVFAPLEDIGLIIVDEEHDTSYRQNESPFYNGRDLAVMRAHAAGATIILGSATPAIESFHNAKTGKYHYLQMPTRIGGRPLAKAELIDMREVFKKAGKDVVFSPALIDAIKKAKAKGEQTMILLNRRGFSSFVLCRSCGESLRCKNCDITLTYHKAERKLTCHYCGYTTDPPQKCPFCGSEYLYFIGPGTEQLEEVLQRTLPDLRIARVDRDTMSRKGEMAKTLSAFDRGETDVLVGTQMIAKGHDFHNVTLVGVVSVDNGLGLPDFRSAERTFQLLTQVAGRAGRGDLAGRVMIQTYYPEHYALRHAAEQDYESFYTEEVKYRSRMGYPPFVVLASILIKHKDEDYALRSGRILREAFDRANTNGTSRVIGPAKAAISRIRNEFRFQMILRSTNRRDLRHLIDTALAEAETRGCDRRIVFVEIDPVNLM
ncbi:MAG: primosomal protein N' [Acidobacteria bacterium]|nr:primosomal protein N' [Acidobacteriota bacterium]